MSAMPEAQTAGRNEAGNYEYLTFRLGNEDYGVDILKVQEIRGYDANITALANAPAFIKGVVNLRGVIVPIVDMRIRLNMDKPVYNELTAVIILNLASQVVGVVVDAVSDVVAMAAAHIRPAPPMGASINAKYVTGIAAFDDSMIILVDIDSLFAASDLAAVEAA